MVPEHPQPAVDPSGEAGAEDRCGDDDASRAGGVEEEEPALVQVRCVTEAGRARSVEGVPDKRGTLVEQLGDGLLEAQADVLTQGRGKGDHDGLGGIRPSVSRGEALGDGKRTALLLVGIDLSESHPHHRDTVQEI